jgi:hypothetical protein
MANLKWTKYIWNFIQIFSYALSHPTTKIVRYLFNTVRTRSVFAALIAVHTEGHTKNTLYQTLPNSHIARDKPRGTH